MVVADAEISLTITGNGDVLEPYDGVIGATKLLVLLLQVLSQRLCISDLIFAIAIHPFCICGLTSFMRGPD